MWGALYTQKWILYILFFSVVQIPSPLGIKFYGRGLLETDYEGH